MDACRQAPTCNPVARTAKRSNSNCEENEGTPSCNSNGEASAGSERQNSKSVTEQVTYWGLLRSNRSFCFFLASFSANLIGEWLTYLAALTAIEKIQEEQQHLSVLHDEARTTSRTAIGLLVAIRLMTKAMMTFFGGVLADDFDRKKAMIGLDLTGAVVAFCFVLAVNLRSIPMIYVATLLQEISSGLYEPSRRSILPLLVPNKHEFKKATIIATTTYSLAQAFGNAAGGFLLSFLGMQGCFIADSLTYLLSALLLGKLQGEYDVSSKDTSLDSPLLKVKTMFIEGFHYIRCSYWGPVIFFKFCALWLTLDVVNISFAERGGENAPIRLGFLFSSVGIGLMIGPAISDRFIDMNQPHTLQMACLFSLGIASFACLSVGMFDMCPYWLVCTFTSLRAMGVCIVWVYSSLLLQSLSAPKLYGRVCSIDSALAFIGESLSAMFTGQLQDELHFSPEQVCLSLGLIGSAMLMGWALFHVHGGGAARSQNKKSLQLQSLLCPSLPLQKKERKLHAFLA